MDNGQFVQISVATMPSPTPYALVYALDEQGNVWKLVDGGVGGAAQKWTMLRNERQS
jgi:NAD(P)H-flavin reductase